jgi:fluoroquinolone transport system permease protein
MNAAALRALVFADSRLLWRDPLLGWVLFLPVGLAIVLRILIPRASDALLLSRGFDLAPYFPMIMGGYLMTAPGIVGMVIGFLLLDERDARTLTALRVTPVSMRQYLSYRIALPLLVGTVSTLVGYPLIGIGSLSFSSLVPIAAVAGLAAPLLALVLATAAPNKVAGFAVMKVLNAVNLLPVASFVLPLPIQFIAGVLPTYWPMRALWSAMAGDDYGGQLAAGAVLGTLAVVIAGGLFDRRLLRRGQ